MGKISGTKVKAPWFNPVDGEITKIGIDNNTGIHNFDSPGKPVDGNDWVLMLDFARLLSSLQSPGFL